MADMSSRIKVEGLGEFRAAMKSAAASVKEMTAAEKAAEAQYKATGDASAYQEAKADALRGKMKAQRQAVDVARQACEKLQKAGVTPDDSRLVHWRTQLNAAQAALATTQAALTATRAQFKETEQTAQTFWERISGTGQKEKYGFIEAQQALKNVDEAMTGVIQHAAELGRGVWETAVGASQWADDLLTQSVQTGIDTDTLQAWEYAAQFVDTEVSSIIGARTKLLSAMKGGEPLDIAGTLVKTAGRTWDDVFWDAVDALGAIQDETARNQAAMQIFGKSFSDLLPLINAGRDAWEGYTREAREAGVVLSGDQVQALGSFNDSLQRMNAATQGFTNTLMAGLAPGMETISDAVQRAASSMSAWLNSTEGKAVLKEMSGTIAHVVSSLSGALPGALQTVTAAFRTLGQVVTWLGENVWAVEAFFGVLAATKAANTVLSVVEAFKQLRLFAMGNPFLLAITGAVIAAGMLVSFLEDAVGNAEDLQSGLRRLKATVNFTNAQELRDEIRDAATLSGTVQEVKVAVHAQWQEGVNQLEQAASDGRVTQQEAGALLSWVKETLDPDIAEAEEYCRQMWNRAYRAAATPAPMTEEERPESEGQTAAIGAMTLWVKTAVGGDFDDAYASAVGMWQALSDAAGGKVDLTAFTGEPTGPVFDAMVTYIQTNMGVDYDTAVAMAGKLWGSLQTVAVTPPREVPSGSGETLALTVMSTWISGSLDEDYAAATADAAAMWQSLSDVAGGDLTLTAFTGEPDGPVFDAMVSYIQTNMGVDYDTAVAMAGKLWGSLQTAAVNAPDLVDPYAGGEGGTQGAEGKQILTHYIEQTMGLDHDAAVALADQYWSDVMDHINGSGVSDASAAGTAAESVRGTKISETLTALQQVRNELETAIAELAAAGNDATEQQLQRVRDLMGEAERLQGRLKVLTSDAMVFAEGAYNIVRAGKGSAKDFGQATAYVESMYQLGMEEANDQLAAAEQRRMGIWADAASTQTERDAADAEWAAAQEAYTGTVSGLSARRSGMLSDILLGQAAAGGLNVTPEQLAAWTKNADLLARVRAHSSVSGLTAEDWAAMQQYLPEDLEVNGWNLAKTNPELLYNLFSNTNSDLYGSAGNAANAVEDALAGALADSIGADNPFMTTFQGMLDAGTFEDMDWSQASGALAAAAKLNLLTGDSFSPDDYTEIGSNVVEGTAQGIEQNADKPAEAGTRMAEGTTEAVEAAFDEHSPSKVFETIGENLGSGLAEGIRAGTPQAVAAAVAMAEAVRSAVASALEIASPSRVMADMGRFTGLGLAEGIDASLRDIGDAASRMAAAVTAPVETAAGAAGAASGGNSYSTSSAIYVDKYFQRSDADLEDLAAKLRALQSEGNRGFGARR